MIDNFQQIENFINKYPGWEPGYFYFVQILTRSKDGHNKSVRVIKTYYVDSEEWLQEKKDEITKLCEFFNARAYINLNRKSYEKVAFKLNTILAQQLEFGQHRIAYLYDSAVGQLNSDYKVWVLDIDDPFVNLPNLYRFINGLQPEGDKILDTIETVNGYHILTKPFNVQEFYKIQPKEYVICKNNPTLLYYSNRTRI